MDPSFRDLSEALLRGEKPIGLGPDAFHPMTPLLQAERVADGVVFAASFSNVAAIETADGLVMVDTGSFLLADATRALLRERVKAPLHTAIFTHGHVDHCFGVEGYEAEPGAARARVIGHERIAARFDRYLLTLGYNRRINRRQFQTEAEFPGAFRYPDTTYRERLDVAVGGRVMQLEHALGETDDATIVWLPDCKALFAGDLFIWASPNCGNPQKAQRYPRQWAEALRRMQSLGAELLCPGHGVPIFGADAIARALGDTARLLESLCDQTLALMNEGARLDQVLAEVRAPEELLMRPYLRPIYDEPEFVVRAIWREYGGWYDGNPAHLKPGPDAALALEVAGLCGGAAALCDRAAELAAEGRLALACQLGEWAAQAAPGDAAIARARRDIYAKRAATEPSLMARGIFRDAAAADARVSTKPRSRR